MRKLLLTVWVLIVIIGVGLKVSCGTVQSASRKEWQANKELDVGYQLRAEDLFENKAPTYPADSLIGKYLKQHTKQMAEIHENNLSPLPVLPKEDQNYKVVIFPLRSSEVSWCSMITQRGVIQLCGTVEQGVTAKVQCLDSLQVLASYLSKDSSQASYLLLRWPVTHTSKAIDLLVAKERAILVRSSGK